MSISLLAKWLKSENTSSKESREIARKIRTKLDLSPRQYRKLLSHLRQGLNIVERDMCAQTWGEIDYQKVSSRAALLYRKAFRKNDADRYGGFMDQVTKGHKKVKASVLYPHEIVEQCRGQSHYSQDTRQELDNFWNALPNYLKGVRGKNRLVVVDTSMSMNQRRGNVRKMDVSIALGIYFSERNTGKFKNQFITFSETPVLVGINPDDNIVDKVAHVVRASWSMNTNLQAVFRLILDTAIKHHIPKKDMPAQIYIISDMQFDSCVEGTNLDGIKAKYNRAGYKVPEIVFWNLDGNHESTPAQADDDGVGLVSGYSPSLLRFMLTGKITNPVELMLETLNNERYRVVQV